MLVDNWTLIIQVFKGWGSKLDEAVVVAWVLCFRVETDLIIFVFFKILLLFFFFIVPSQKGT